jgi:hypothetical protein
MNDNQPDGVGDLFRRFYATYGMPGEGPPPEANVTQIMGADTIRPDDMALLSGALNDLDQMRQFARCRDVLNELATAMTGDILLQELSSVTTRSEGEFDSMLSGVLWFSMAASLDERKDGMPVTPFDEHFHIPLALKVRSTIEGSLVLRLYLALVYMREGVLSMRIAHGARSGLLCCGRVSKLLNSDYVRRIRNALSHGTFASCAVGIAFRDNNGTIVATPGFMTWMCHWLMLVQLQGLAAVAREPEDAESVPPD